jgi:hypothetical protein
MNSEKREEMKGRLHSLISLGEFKAVLGVDDREGFQMRNEK